MRALKRMISILLITILCLGLGVSYAHAEAFETRRYDVEINLFENNSFVVTENIQVDFSEPRHGIFRYLPYRGTVISEVDGKVVEEPYRLLISDIYAEGYPFEAYKESGNAVIQIGDAGYRWKVAIIKFL